LFVSSFFFLDNKNRGKEENKKRREGKEKKAAKGTKRKKKKKKKEKKKDKKEKYARKKKEGERDSEVAHETLLTSWKNWWRRASFADGLLFGWHCNRDWRRSIPAASSVGNSCSRG